MIDDAGVQRRLRSDDRERHPFAFRKRSEPGHVVRGNGLAASQLGDPGIPGGGDYLDRSVVAEELPGERMLARPSADDEDLYSPGVPAPGPRKASLNASFARSHTSPTFPTAAFTSSP